MLEHQISASGDLLVKGQRYQVVWGDPERLPSGLVLDAAVVVGWLKMGGIDGYRWLQM